MTEFEIIAAKVDAGVELTDAEHQYLLDKLLGITFDDEHKPDDKWLVSIIRHKIQLDMKNRLLG